jgi:hypothetical protein
MLKKSLATRSTQARRDAPAALLNSLLISLREYFPVVAHG